MPSEVVAGESEQAEAVGGDAMSSVQHPEAVQALEILACELRRGAHVDDVDSTDGVVVLESGDRLG
ncbi:MAG: hypothetical protein AAGG08_13260, partial [Actinomycetota bacterium]